MDGPRARPGPGAEDVDADDAVGGARGALYGADDVAGDDLHEPLAPHQPPLRQVAPPGDLEMEGLIPPLIPHHPSSLSAGYRTG